MTCIYLLPFQLDWLAALGYFPVLLMEKKCKNSYTADVLSSIQMKLDGCLEEDLKSVYEKVLCECEYFTYCIDDLFEC